MKQKSDYDLAQIIWDYMRYEQPLQKADVIVGLGSADLRTAEWSAELYKESYAPTIVFSGARGDLTSGSYAISEADAYEARALGLGVPQSAIIKESEAKNTGENIVLLHKKFAELDLKPEKVILVTKPYMLRRTYATFMKQWPGEFSPQIFMSAINLTMDEYTTNSYIKLDYMINIMVGDLQRIKEYPRLGFQIEQDIPVNVWEAYEELVRRGYTKHLLSKII